MAHQTDRRAMLIAAGSVAIAAATGAGASEAHKIQGTVEYESGEVIPKGRLKVFLRNSTSEAGAQQDAIEAELQSDGGSDSISFSFSPPEMAVASSGHEIIATLERADGWLLARGSSVYEPNFPVRIVLYTVMY
ncbi:hypothetical protein JJJ17_00225 [Paracoccus caeni]|uniref:Uncharacterized protein n=1 Tax=Paracoccus caeni TaxID=657651 RepID=A0A934S8H7_9RHOB|nr:hypothetical protein [Paracoccus caeni]MBK4214340.1 hypothetical protein [Paracoccus caeni]